MTYKLKFRNINGKEVVMKFKYLRTAKKQQLALRKEKIASKIIRV